MVIVLNIHRNKASLHLFRADVILTYFVLENQQNMQFDWGAQTSTHNRTVIGQANGLTVLTVIYDLCYFFFFFFIDY